MKQMGFKMTMTSTQADEGAQHFYRKLGYKDAGCLLLVASRSLCKRVESNFSGVR
jgi:hypothetical protein